MRAASGQSACLIAVVFLAPIPLRAADARDPLTRARQLYNERKWEAAVAAADQARSDPARVDAADLIAARAYLERYRDSAGAADLGSARERLRRHCRGTVPDT